MMMMRKILLLSALYLSLVASVDALPKLPWESRRSSLAAQRGGSDRVAGERKIDEDQVKIEVSVERVSVDVPGVSASSRLMEDLMNRVRVGFYFGLWVR